MNEPFPTGQPVFGKIKQLRTSLNYEERYWRRLVNNGLLNQDKFTSSGSGYGLINEKFNSIFLILSRLRVLEKIS